MISCASVAVPAPGCSSSVRSRGVPFKVPVAAAQIPGGTLDPADVPKYPTPMLIPPVMPRAGTITHAGRQAGRLLRDLGAAVRPADPARRAPGHDRVGLRRRSRRRASRGLLVHNAPVADHRGQGQPAGARQVDQRAGRRQRQLPAAPAAGRPDAALGQPAGRHGRPRHAADVRLDTPARTPARCRSSPTRTAPSASATRATATPRRGTCPPPTTSRPATPPRAPGTTSSRARRRRSSASTWGPGFATFQYPNAGRAATTWYHDHALGMTRLNVYAGPGRLLHRPWRPRRRHGGSRQPHRHHGRRCPGPAPQRRRQVPAQQALLRDRRSPSRTARSTPTARSSTPTPGPSSTGSPDRTSPRPTSRRSGTPSSSAT